MIKYDGHKNTLYSACIQIGLTHRSAKFQHKQEIIMITLKIAYAQNFTIRQKFLYTFISTVYCFNYLSLSKEFIDQWNFVI